MQTSKIKVGGLYAYKRGGELVRFYVTEIITRRSTRDTTNQIAGHILEDAKGGTHADTIKLDPTSLLGPWDEQSELVERKAREDAERKAREEARMRQAKYDRRALYRFVGVEVPQKSDEYSQLFRVSYGSSLDFSRDGMKAIVAKVHELSGKPAEAPEPATTPALSVVANNK